MGLALLVSVLAGLLVAGLAAPVVGAAGVAGKAVAEEFLALPAELQTPQLATRSQVLAADGSVLATFYRVNRVGTTWEQIPLVMRQAQIAVEDARFYEHHGVDYQGTLRAAVTNAVSGRVAQGGSTITQQYVKNALLEAARDDKQAQNAAREASLERKMREARYALAVERELSKDEILHRYLQVAYFGHGVYGVGTAAQYYFGVPVSKLTLAQSAVLAGVVQNPAQFDLASRDRRVRADVVRRRNVVLTRMRDVGFISEQQRAQTAAQALPKIKVRPVASGCDDPVVRAPFFCAHVRELLEDTEIGAALGDTRQARQNQLLTGGLTIRTTLDPRVQKAAQRAVNRQVPRDDPAKVAAVADVVEPVTGAVRAMAVNRAYGDAAGKGETKVDLATGGTFGVQPGSTFKVFWLAEALRDGMPLDEELYAPAQYEMQRFSYQGADGKPRPISNAEVDEAGRFDLRSGTHASVNTFYAQIVERIGLSKPLALAESLGVQQLNRGQEQPLPRVPSAFLGTAGVSPLAMAGAFATFAAAGRHCPPHAVTAISGPDGRQLPLPPTRCRQVVERDVANTVTDVLTGVIDGDDPLRTGRGASLRRPAAGKTGTTNGSTAAWFVGYTPQLATAVWVGKHPDPKPMRSITINNRYYKQVYGGSVPAAVFQDLMRNAHRNLPEKKFDAPPRDPESSASD
ncbi:MAG: penicillin-binding protein [Actinomycetota bacterium]|nr:penicillin-binding protein [Actinomycetota bacterium]